MREMIEGAQRRSGAHKILVIEDYPSAAPRPIYVVPGMAEAAFVCPLFATLFACKRGL